MFVRNWMTSPALVIPRRVSVTAALGFMEKRRIRRLPVVENGSLIGIITRSDLLNVLGRERDPRRAAGLDVGEVMTKNPLRVTPDDTIEFAANLMLQKRISGLPVDQEGRVVGVITESDLFRALCGLLGIGEGGARVVMEVKEDDDMLEALEQRLRRLRVKSLAAYHNTDKKRWEIVARVRGRRAAKPERVS